MRNLCLFIFIIFNFVKFCLLNIKTNSPVFCLKGKSCQLQLINDKQWDENQENCFLNENNKTICYCLYNTNSDNLNNFCNEYEFTIIIFSLNNENNTLIIKIENYNDLNNLTIKGIIDDDIEETNLDTENITFNDYQNIFGLLTFSIIYENNTETENKNPDSGEIEFPVISFYTFSPNYISTVEEVNTIFQIPILTTNISEYFNNPKLIIDSEEINLELFEIIPEYFLYNFKSISNITIKPSNETIYHYLQYNSIFTNIQKVNLSFVPIDINLTDFSFLIGVFPKSSIINIIYKGFEHNIEPIFLLKNSEGEFFNSTIEDNTVDITIDIVGDYEVYLLLNNYYIKTSKIVYLTYPIEFDDIQNNNERFLTQRIIKIRLKNSISKDKIIVVLYNNDINSQNEIDDYSLENNGKIFILNEPIIKSGNYKLTIMSKFSSVDNINYNFKIYENITLEKKYIITNQSISVIYTSDIYDILLNNASIKKEIDITNESIDVKIRKNGLNNISLLFSNYTDYLIGEIIAIPSNYFQLNYNNCITGDNSSEEILFNILTTNISEDINISNLFYSYQKENEEKIENIFPENFTFKIPYENNVKYTIQIYEKNHDIFSDNIIESPKFVKYNILTPAFKSSIIFSNVTCILGNLSANIESEKIKLKIICPNEINDEYIKCKINDNFLKYDNYTIKYSNYIIGEISISGDLLENDPEIIIFSNFLKENEIVNYTLQGYLFDIKQLDYVILNNNIISDFDYNEKENTKLFSIKLKQGIYNITFVRKKVNISSIIEDDISILYQNKISIPIEIKLQHLNVKWVKYNESGSLLNYILFQENFILENETKVYLISQTEMIETLRCNCIPSLRQCIFEIINNSTISIYKFLLIFPSSIIYITSDIVIISEKDEPYFIIEPFFLVLPYSNSTVNVNIMINQEYDEIFGVKCDTNDILKFNNNLEVTTTLTKGNKCYYYVEYGKEKINVSSIDFEIYESYDEFLFFYGEIIQKKCYFMNDFTKPKISIMYKSNGKYDYNIFSNYVQKLNIYLKLDNEIILFNYNDDYFTTKEDLIEGNLTLVVEDSLNNLVCNIKNIIITNANFDSFGSIDFTSENSIFKVYDLLCILNFTIYNNEKYKKCEIQIESNNNKYNETIICFDLTFGNYYLYIEEHQALEYSIQYFRTKIQDPDIEFTIIKPNSLTILKEIDNEIYLKSNEFYIPYIKTIKIRKFYSNETEDIIYNINDKDNYISVIGSNFASFIIKSPDENSKYKIISIEDISNNTKYFLDNSLILEVGSCTIYQKQYFLKNKNQTLRIMKCSNSKSIENIIEIWKVVYLNSNNYPEDFESCTNIENSLYCNLKSNIIISKLSSIILYNQSIIIELNYYEINQLCLLIPSENNISITLFGYENRDFTIIYSGNPLAMTVKTNETFIFYYLNVAYQPIKIIINDIVIEDQISLYNKIMIDDKSTFEDDKDNYIYYIYLNFINNSFIYNPNIMTFSLINQISNFEVISSKCEIDNIKNFNLKCEFNKKELNEGIYDLYYKNENYCNYSYIINKDYVITLFPFFTIDYKNMICDSDSSIILYSDMNLTNITISNVNIINIYNETIKLNNSLIDKNDYYIKLLFDLSSEKGIKIIKGDYTLLYNITKDNVTKYYSNDIYIKEPCDKEKGKVNNGKGECDYCINKNENYSYFDYFNRFDIDSKRCINECHENQVYYNYICFNNCNDALNFVTQNISYYIEINNRSCFYFILENITNEIASLDNQKVNLTFNLNDIIDPNYFIDINIGNFTQKLCESSINKILICTFDFSEIKDDSITFQVSFTLNNNIKIITNKEVTIKKSVSYEQCEKENKYLNTEKERNYCKCKTNKYNENGKCVKKCSTLYFNSEECINECLLYKLKEEENYTEHKNCLNKCPNGYEINEENLICYCNKHIIDNICTKSNDTNPMLNVYPKFIQATSDAALNFTFEYILNNSHRLESVKLTNNKIEIFSYNCTKSSNYSFICLFNLSEITNDINLSIHYRKRINKSYHNSQINIQVLHICPFLEVRNEYDNFICSSCQKRENETSYFQNFNCVESCDNITYYKSAIYENYCIDCKDEDSYLYEEENICVLNCYDIYDKENDIKNNLCVKLTPICPNNYCYNGGECYVINKTLTCDCPSLYFGDLCEFEINSTNINEFNSVFNETVNLINSNNSVIHNQTIFDLAQIMRIIVQLTKSNDENYNEMGIIFYQKNIDNFIKIKNYTLYIFNEIIIGKIKIENDTDIKSLLIFSSTSIFYLTRTIKPELLTKLKSNLNNRNLNNNDILLQNELLELIQKIHKINIIIYKKLDLLSSITSLNIKKSEDNLIFFVIWTSNEISKSEYKIKSLSLKIPILNHDINPTESIKYYIETAFSSDILYSLDKNSPSKSAFFTMFNISNIENNISNCQISFSLNTNSFSKLNETMIEFYNKRGIDPYNKNDLAFKEKCFRSINFEYDLTQNYRREKVYSGNSIKSISSNCVYSSYNLREKRLIINCNELNENYNVGYEFIKDPLNKEKIDNLPIKCAKKFSGISENIGFWLFLTILIVYILTNFFLKSKKKKEIIKQITNNNKSINIDDSSGRKIYSIERSIENETKVNEITEDINNEDFNIIFSRNFIILHPLTFLCKESILCPLSYKLIIFFNEIINILGWNSVLFDEQRIEKRIYDNNRNNFFYSLINEFDRIFTSILITIISTVILRFFNLTLLKEEKNDDDINETETSSKIEEKIKKIKNNKFRIIGFIIMIFFFIFFWFYCTMFCSMYVNTQFDWLYSVIWSLLFIYLIFSPSYIFVISLFDINEKEKCSYYMKMLFIF